MAASASSAVPSGTAAGGPVQPKAAPRVAAIPAGRADAPFELRLAAELKAQGEHLAGFVASFRYTGFDRDAVRAKTGKTCSPRELIQIAIAGAFRGTQEKKYAAISMTLDDDTTKIMLTYFRDKNILVKAGGTGVLEPDTLTIQRVVSAFPEIVAIALKIAGHGQEFLGLPGWLQFPAAVGLRMTPQHRSAHRQWQVWFSRQIRGRFDARIYEAAASKADVAPPFRQLYVAVTTAKDVAGAKRALADLDLAGVAAYIEAPTDAPDFPADYEIPRMALGDLFGE